MAHSSDTRSGAESVALITVGGWRAEEALRDLARRLEADRDLRLDCSVSLTGPPAPPESMGDVPSLIEAIVSGVSAVGQIIATILVWRDSRGSRKADDTVVRIEYQGSQIVIRPDSGADAADGDEGRKSRPGELDEA